MKTKNLIEGLEILMPYYDDQEGCWTECGGDAFIAIKPDRSLTEEDFKKMESLDWVRGESGNWILVYW